MCSEGGWIRNRGCANALQQVSKLVVVCTGLLALLGLGSCAFPGDFAFYGHNHRPKGRIGRNASATVLTNFTGQEIGEHSYGFGGNEKNGIVYTCRAGHIDLAHVRKSIDWTAYLASRVYEVLLQNETEFSFLVNEPAGYHVKICYPADWDILAGHEMKSIAREVAIDLGGYLAFTSTTLHEIFTWYHFNITIVFSEFSSAFSWEDNTSNLLGSIIGKKVLRLQGDFSKTTTRILDQELEWLEIQPRSTAKQASAKMKGQWYTGGMFLKDMKQRHFDIGLDGSVESCIVDMPECDGCTPEVFPIPNLNDAHSQGFLIEVEIKPFLMKERLLSAAYPDDKDRPNVITPEHFTHIMQSIAKEAKALGYAFVQ
jgi:hypothetical protein